mmetsp:Transcript_10277/g.23741  ORF Transcript_10277/g.23741 Transcript_10277/m.23741 type:complete len:251 (+) Transcript_10277:1414-2166(+)
MPKIYGIGASIVITGAMFKLLNWPGGVWMLGLGLTTEAIIFFLGSFEPEEKGLDWTKVYPELLDTHDASASPVSTRPLHPVRKKLDDLFAQAQIDGALIERLGQGMQRLSDTAANLASVPDLTEVTQKYLTNIEKATIVLGNIGEVQEGTLSAMNRLVHISQSMQDYHSQVRGITETLRALNTVYKQEVQEADVRSKTTHEVYHRIAGSIKKLQSASEEAERFETALAQLSEKLASLNSIYGNMLLALKR